MVFEASPQFPARWATGPAADGPWQLLDATNSEDLTSAAPSVPPPPLLGTTPGALDLLAQSCSEASEIYLKASMAGRHRAGRKQTTDSTAWAAQSIAALPTSASQQRVRKWDATRW